MTAGGPGAQPPAVEVVAATHRWRRRGRRVLDGVDLTLASGTLTWLAGPNGAGKTTLLRVIGGVIEPESGEVRVHGVPAAGDDARFARQVTFLPAGNAGLYARLTARQHLDLWARIAYVAPEERAGRIEHYLDALGLRELAAQRVDRLSAGQRQRVRIATALIAEAPLTLLDEPRNSLDADGLAGLGEALAAAREAGRTVVWCAPEGEDAGLQHDQGLFLRDGRLERVA